MKPEVWVWSLRAGSQIILFLSFLSFFYFSSEHHTARSPDTQQHTPPLSAITAGDTCDMPKNRLEGQVPFWEGSVAIGIEVSALKKIMLFLVVPFLKFYVKKIMRQKVDDRIVSIF